MLTYEQLCKAVDSARSRFGLLKKKYPELKAYLVFSRFGPGSGQCELTTDGEKILRQFPEMVVDNPAKETALKALKRDKSEKPNVDGTFLGFHDNVLIELRFAELRYELIRQIQNDPLIDRSKSEVGTIRAVLGSIAELVDNAESE